MMEQKITNEVISIAGNYYSSIKLLLQKILVPEEEFESSHLKGNGF